MKLYYYPGACSLSPHIVLREAGFAFELEKVDLQTRKTETGADYLGINAKGYVPTLQLDDGQFLSEGPAIVQYLADLKPEARLAPKAGTLERARLQEWLNFISTEIHKQYSPLFNPKTPQEAREAQIEKLAQRYDHVAKQLDGKPYLLGEHFGVADAYLFTVTNWAGFLKVDLPSLPALKPYMTRIAERPAVQAALKAEGLAKG
jgi:glutathione S-transferase